MVVVEDMLDQERLQPILPFVLGAALLRGLEAADKLPAAVAAHGVVHHGWCGPVGGHSDRDHRRLKGGAGRRVRLDDELRTVRR